MKQTATNIWEIQESLVQVEFPVTGADRLSSLHAYNLYAGIKTHVSWVAQCPETIISTIPGVKDGQKGLEIQEFSRLLIRTPISKAGSWYGLAGKTLSVGQGNLTLGIPRISPLQPKSNLQARIVIVHLRDGGDEVNLDRFLISVRHQLEAKGIEGDIDPNTLERKVLLIKGKKLPGYGMRITRLSDTDSIKLQSLGLGGKKKMGAGFFI